MGQNNVSKTLRSESFSQSIFIKKHAKRNDPRTRYCLVDLLRSLLLHRSQEAVQRNKQEGKLPFLIESIYQKRDVNNRSAANEKLSEGMTGENTGRSSMKPSGNTHYNIFGDPPVSPRRAGKVYHMSSDIFGVGSIVSRSGQHLNNQSDQKGFHDTDSSNAKAGDANKNNGGLLERKGSTTKMPDDWKPNARENGCNPVTGDGYAEDILLG
ncbi:unnamed protein product [Allacma fusca]|uniref:Uncharacterized protein n=1 Tax=Allacma fusca TaxID=39272 RepID=A0A8J2JVI7_9HEXA|nr:unnamed protein product [Allacma fusca]